MDTVIHHPSAPLQCSHYSAMSASSLLPLLMHAKMYVSRQGLVGETAVRGGKSPLVRARTRLDSEALESLVTHACDDHGGMGCEGGLVEHIILLNGYELHVSRCCHETSGWQTLRQGIAKLSQQGTGSYGEVCCLGVIRAT